MEYRTFVSRASADRYLKRMGLEKVPRRYDSVLAEHPSKKTVLPVLLATMPEAKRAMNEKGWAADVNHLDVRVGTTVKIHERVPAAHHDELAKVLRFVNARGPKRVVLDRALGGTTIWRVEDLKPA